MHRAVRHAIDNTTDACVFASDCTNAFGTMRRDHILKAPVQFTSQLAKPSGSCLLDEKWSWVREQDATWTRIPTVAGILQGCPSGPAGFALGMRLCLDELRTDGGRWTRGSGAAQDLIKSRAKRCSACGGTTRFSAGGVEESQANPDQSRRSCHSSTEEWKRSRCSNDRSRTIDHQDPRAGDRSGTIGVITRAVHSRRKWPWLEVRHQRRRCCHDAYEMVCD